MRLSLPDNLAARPRWRSAPDLPRLDLSAVRRTYRRCAGFYDAMFGELLQPGRLAAVNAANAAPGERVLEVGVGTGLSLAAYRSDSRVVGIDACAEMLDRARRRVGRRSLAHVEALLEMDAQAIDFADGSFDAVVALYTMTVVPDPARVAGEMRRVCRPGGRIAIVNHFTPDHPVLRDMESACAPLLSRVGFRSDLDLRQLVEAMRLEPVEVRSTDVLGFWKLALFINR